VNKISKTISAFGQIIRNPWLLNKVLDDDRFWQRKVEREFGFSKGLPVIQPVDLFGEFEEKVEPFAFLDGGSLPTDLALLKKLAGRFTGCRYFEIGTWRGESVANVASVANHCTTLNLSAKEMESLGLNRRYIDLHGFYSKKLPNVTHLEGNSKTFSFDSLNSKFDLIFIDGDHHVEMVTNDTQKVFSHLLHDNSIVVWHDYARNPETIRFEILYGILKGIPERFHKNLFHIANTLCAVYIPGYQGSEFLHTPVEPKGYYSVHINYHEMESR